MTILVTNDDGFLAKGINCLIEAIKDLGHIVVVAPDGPRSAQSKAITVNTPLRFWKHREEGQVEMYRCNGTPCDCIKVGIHLILHGKPDLIISGINHGSNSSLNVVYSGTMGAAMEGCSEGVPAVGLSLCTHNPDADFTEAVKYSRIVIEKVIKEGLPTGVCLNVNVPNIIGVKGIKVVRQCVGYWAERFQEGIDPAGHHYYWLTGDYVNNEPDAEDTDEGALNAGYCSVVPCHVDITHYPTIDLLKKNWNL